MKAVFRGKFLSFNARTRKKDLKVSNLSFHLRKLKKEEQLKSKISRGKERRIRPSINGMKNNSGGGGGWKSMTSKTGSLKVLMN